MRVFPGIRGSGVNQTKSALYIFNGLSRFAPPSEIHLRRHRHRFRSIARPKTLLSKSAPSIASALGRQLEISREKLRLMAPVGAAAGLAAAFNAPSLPSSSSSKKSSERWSAGILGSVVLSAVASVVVVRSFLGSEPLFRIPVTTFKRPTELIAYAVLGIAGGLASVAFAKSIGYFRPLLKACHAGPNIFSPPSPDSSSDSSASSAFPRSWAPATTPWIRPCTASTPGKFSLSSPC